MAKNKNFIAVYLWQFNFVCGILTIQNLSRVMQPYLAPVSFMVSMFGVKLWESIPTLWSRKCRPDVSAVPPAVAFAVPGSVCRKLSPFTSSHSKPTHARFVATAGGTKGGPRGGGRSTTMYSPSAISFIFWPNFSISLISEHQKLIN